MSLWVEKANRSRFSLMVSIPQNDPEMARAAETGGADAVKVHLNVVHPASGLKFGSFKEERKKLEAVAKAISIPLGVVPGDKNPASLEELTELHRLGFDFFDIFAHDLPSEYLDAPLGRMICVDSGYTPADVKQLALKTAQVFEASVIPHEGYGQPVVREDLVRWKALTQDLKTPLLISTQRKIQPEECGLLKDAGARGIVIGVVVTGLNTKGVENTTRRFRNAIDKLP